MCAIGSSFLQTGVENTGTACLTETDGATPNAGGLITSDCWIEGSGGAEKTGTIFRTVTGGAILLCGVQCLIGM